MMHVRYQTCLTCEIYCCEAHCAVFTLPHRTAKRERLRKRRSRRRMGRRKKKEEENKKERGKRTKQSQRWVRKCISVRYKNNGVLVEGEKSNLFFFS